ncbi:class I SAM-dependent methyltransferase [Staphylococcus pseudintermedius]|uniref:class I SAM-dependent methyltransferase n=1 Tax=Staphylococcus pseudintermedius TaxID=283734 RepID=UPI0019F4A3F7|nr:class I SAM-dependent methyltransferase [Staphylococcus pseudintermedius]EGQ3526190.1 class I SAM-dependent methyltransferase [Staphylococcus pseudintermedius]ELJ9316154.1 class I SAM-dependent methyltransferase [Staphylococcus pseudintermedius]WQL14964.1 class I SAM-dependent methyltransferase [Staphylococcus pseudintermedius]
MHKSEDSSLEVEKLDFSSLVGIVREPNMCSGGRETIRRIIIEGNIAPDSKILEVGSNTGFSSIEFANVLPNSKVIGIDINKQSVEFSKQKAKKYLVNNVEFIHSDARNLPFEDNSFDVVFVSNVTSFINEKETAIKEYLRVLRPGGMFVTAPIYYRNIPSSKMINEVELAINAKLDIQKKEDWKRLFLKKELFLYHESDYEYIKSSDKEINEYVEMVMSQKHLNKYTKETRNELSERLKYFYTLFDENLSFAGFSILIYKYKDANNIPVLHKTKKLKS